MAWLESLLPLLIFAIYALSQLRRSGKKKPRPQPAPDAQAPHPEAARAPTPFEELIRQIQRAAEEAQRETEPPPPPEPARLPQRPLPEDPEFQSVGGFEHEQHGFGADNPFSEERFERLPRGADIVEHPPGHLDFDPHGLSRSAPRRKPTASRDVLSRLRSPSAARDAILLKEILDRPRGRRR